MGSGRPRIISISLPNWKYKITHQNYFIITDNKLTKWSREARPPLVSACSPQTRVTGHRGRLTILERGGGRVSHLRPLLDAVREHVHETFGGGSQVDAMTHAALLNTKLSYSASASSSSSLSYCL